MTIDGLNYYMVLSWSGSDDRHWRPLKEKIWYGDVGRLRNLCMSKFFFFLVTFEIFPNYTYIRLLFCFQGDFWKDSTQGGSNTGCDGDLRYMKVRRIYFNIIFNWCFVFKHLSRKKEWLKVIFLTLIYGYTSQGVLYSKIMNYTICVTIVIEISSYYSCFSVDWIMRIPQWI